MSEDDFLEAQYEDRFAADTDEDEGGWGEFEEDEADAWVVVNSITGTMLRGPFGTAEQAEAARNELPTPARYATAPVYF